MTMNEQIEAAPGEASGEPAERSDSIAELYPELTPDQQAEAAYFLHRYLDLIERIYERTKR